MSLVLFHIEVGVAVDFLIRIEIRLPVDLPAEERNRLLVAEAERGHELIEQGVLRGIWRVPGRTANISLYRVSDADELHGVLQSLPLFPYLDIQVEPLATHPLGHGELGISARPEETA